MYSLKGCKGSNIQGSAQLVDAGPDIQGSVQFGRELKFPLWKIKKRNLLGKPYSDLMSLNIFITTVSKLTNSKCNIYFSLPRMLQKSFLLHFNHLAHSH